MSIYRPFILAVAAAGLLGCNVLEGNGALVSVFTTHHATPENGTFPIRGEDEQPRVFMGDDGWEITIAESYITIASMTLVSCSGSAYDLKMFWGPCPEDLRVADLQTLTVAGLKVPADNYCTLEVEYAPYEEPIIDDESSSRHQIPQNEEVDGVTVFINGIAQRGEDSIPFVLKNGERFTVDLDLNPLTVQRSEDFPKDLTVSKTYDRFFDGVDFTNFDEASLEARLDDVLEDQTQVVAGQVVDPEKFE